MRYSEEGYAVYCLIRNLQDRIVSKDEAMHVFKRIALLEFKNERDRLFGFLENALEVTSQDGSENGFVAGNVIWFLILAGQHTVKKTQPINYHLFIKKLLNFYKHA